MSPPHIAPARIAVIGAGMIGRKHIDVLLSGRQDYTLAAVADPSPVAIQEVARRGYTCYSTIAATLEAAKLDGAIIAATTRSCAAPPRSSPRASSAASLRSAACGSAANPRNTSTSPGGASQAAAQS